MTGSLQDKVVIVTGGDNGIGAATVSQFLENGARVASLDILGSKAAETEYRFHVRCDVSSEANCEATVEEVLNKWGTIDILVNCAAVLDNFQRTSDCPQTMWEKMLSVNLNGSFYLSKHVIRHYLTKSGTAKGGIVNIASTAGIKGADAGVAYTTSKHGLLGLMKSTAWMYAKEGIRCDALIPGGMETDLIKNSGPVFDPVGSKALAPVHATMPGWVKPNEVTEAILFLATASSVNGAQLTIDHGWSIG